MKIEVLAAVFTISIVIWIVILFYSKIAFVITAGLLLGASIFETIWSIYHLVRWILKRRGQNK